MLITIIIILSLGAIFGLLQIGRFIGERQAEQTRLDRRETIVRQLLATRLRPDAKPYANKHEAMVDALLYLEARQIYRAEAIVEEWVSDAEYDEDEFAELMEPNYYGFGYGYLYRVINHQLDLLERVP